MSCLLDSGSSQSLIDERVITKYGVSFTPRSDRVISLITATGDSAPVKGYLRLRVKLGNLECTHKFWLVKSLLTDVILGTDFLIRHRICLDLANSVAYGAEIGSIPLPIPTQDYQGEDIACMVHRRELRGAGGACDTTCDNDCALPNFARHNEFVLPVCEAPFKAVVAEFKRLFSTRPGFTNACEHVIPTEGPPVRVPARRIPMQYREAVEKQLEEMLHQGIIRRSHSPWLAPAVYTLKKSGEVRICIDYRELNKRVRKDAYPLPLPDDVFERLGNAAVFTTVDMHSGFWQMAVREEDRQKTAFSPGPGMGLYEFQRMPFGLSGAPSSFQRLMDEILGRLSFAMVYLDDIIIFSDTVELHVQHLRAVFRKLQAAGVTLRGEKCRVGKPEVRYLGHVFSRNGVEPDPDKTEAITSWTTPTTGDEVKSFLGLCSYYRRFVPNFAQIAAPLHAVANSGQELKWTQECQEAFDLLKRRLKSPPLLAAPDLSKEFQLCTDASEHGIGAVLEQEGRVIAYASRILRPAEKNYSVIEKECLAIVFATKKFRHFLLGSKFRVLTDHAPLQWLAAQKMEGRLARWAVMLQEFDVTITYRPGHSNGNADALSRFPLREESLAAVSIWAEIGNQEMASAQRQDPTIRRIIEQLFPSSGSQPVITEEWKRAPLIRFLQLRKQLYMQDGVLRRKVVNAARNTICVPVIPASLKAKVLEISHNVPAAGHLGCQKTLENAKRYGYWINMARDVEEYVRTCEQCQKIKTRLPAPAPMLSMPVGNPWERVAADILELPTSRHGNTYLLVIQDYFSKWIEAYPMKDQRAVTVAKYLTDAFTRFGLPKVLHTDQGTNFESALMSTILRSFGIEKTRTSPYHPQGDGLVERANRTILQMLRSFAEQEEDWEEHLPILLYAYRMAVHSSIGCSPFAVLFGREPRPLPLIEDRNDCAISTGDYVNLQRRKFAWINRFVRENLLSATERQKFYFDNAAEQRSWLTPGTEVWLHMPRRGKLQASWVGGWSVLRYTSPVNVELRRTDGKVVGVHVNRVRERLKRPQRDDTDFEQHGESKEATVPVDERRPSRNRKLPSRLNDYVLDLTEP